LVVNINDIGHLLDRVITAEYANDTAAIDMFVRVERG